MSPDKTNSGEVVNDVESGGKEITNVTVNMNFYLMPFLVFFPMFWWLPFMNLPQPSK